MDQLNYEQRKELTDQHMRNPMPGDRFTEFFSYWAIVLSVEPNGGAVKELEFLGAHGNLRISKHESVEAFRHSHSYKTIPGYPVIYVDSIGKMPLGDQRMASDVAREMEEGAAKTQGGPRP